MSAAPDPLARAYHRAIALRWWATVLAMPALVPLLLARGLDLAQVGLIVATFAAVTAALEIPTGGLADAFGRVRTTLVADVLAIASRVAFLLAPDVTGFLAAAALGGAARALGSGALEAWYVDARRRRDPGADLQGPLGRAGVVASLAVGSGTLIGGLVPLAAPHLGLGDVGGVAALQLPYLASAALGLVALLATSRLRDADGGPAAGRAAARPDRVLRGAWAALRGDAALAGLVSLAAVSGGTMMTFEALFPAELAARWSGAVTAPLGFAYAGAFAATAFGQTIGARAGGRRPTRIAAIGFAIVAAGSVVLSVPLPPAWGAAVAIAAMMLAYGAMGYAAPALDAAFHERIPPERRAALLSTQSLVGYAGGMAAAVGLGAVAAAAGTSAVWVVWAVVAALTATALAMVATLRRTAAAPT